MTNSRTRPGVDPQRLVSQWFAAHGRDLPWRSRSVTAWGVLVSEIMLQQTPVVRVLPRWQDWMRRWPTPAALAAAPTAEVLRAWDRLGYPRRALRLREAAGVIATTYDGVIPADLAALRTLPGVGEYTAAAVLSFAYRGRAVVLDTNVRRVLARFDAGLAMPAPTLRRAERDRAAQLLPAEAEAAARWNAGVMEVGALVCTAKAPRCGQCPLRPGCAWVAAGKPSDAFAGRRRTQAWHGTDRQVRGRLMAALRQATGPVSAAELAEVWSAVEQRERAMAGLLADGLATATEAGYTLPD